MTIEQFKQITDPDERERLIDKASSAEKDALIKIDRHLMLVRQEGSEDNLKWAREKAVAKARGFQKLEDLFTDRYMIWQVYAGNIFENLGKQAHLSDEQKVTCKQLDQKVDSYIPVIREVHPIIYRLAFSPQAAEIEKKAERIDSEISAKFASGSIATDKELAAIDRAVDEIFTQLQQLPALPATKAQEEFDRFPEAKLRVGGFNNE